MDIDASIPNKLKFLFSTFRYKVAHGGRGSAKSWSFARSLLILAATQRLRILCAREVQKSIKQSVHKLLSDQIKLMGMSSLFQVLETQIRCVNGSEFSFSGLSTHTIDSIKSIEGTDIVWVEEAHNVSKKSWEILIPTIRKDDSEIWISFNPELDTDETYKRFVVAPPPNSYVEEVNYNDNPDFPDVLEQERLHCKATQPAEDYENIWEGKCRTAVAGAIYAKQVAQAVKEKRIGFVPYDPMLKVHAVWDLGWNDSMFITLVQRLRSEIRIIGCIEDDHQTLDWYAAELNKMNYNWGYDFLPHDGTHKDFKTGKSTEQILGKLGRKVKITPSVGVEEGIKIARLMFPRVLFSDRNGAERLVECLKRYRRNVPVSTGEPAKPVHDEFSHGGDCFRYVALNVEQMTNEDDEPQIHVAAWKPTMPGMGA